MAEERQYLAALAIGDKLKCFAINVGANSSQELAMVTQGRFIVMLLNFIPSVAGTLQFKSGAPGNSAGAAAISGAFNVTLNQSYQFGQGAVPTLKAINFNDSLYFVTAGGASVQGWATYFEGVR